MLSRSLLQAQGSMHCNEPRTNLKTVPIPVADLSNTWFLYALISFTEAGFTCDVYLLFNWKNILGQENSLVLTVIWRGQHFVLMEKHVFSRHEDSFDWCSSTQQNYLNWTDQRVETEQRDSVIEKLMDGFIRLQKSSPSESTTGKPFQYSLKTQQHYRMNGPFTVMGSKIKPTAVQPGTSVYNSKKHRTIQGTVPHQA